MCYCHYRKSPGAKQAQESAATLAPIKQAMYALDPVHVQVAKHQSAIERVATQLEKKRQAINAALGSGVEGEGSSRRLRHGRGSPEWMVPRWFGTPVLEWRLARSRMVLWRRRAVSGVASEPTGPGGGGGDENDGFGAPGEPGALPAGDEGMGQLGLECHGHKAPVGWRRAAAVSGPSHSAGDITAPDVAEPPGYGGCKSREQEAGVGHDDARSGVLAHARTGSPWTFENSRCLLHRLAQ